MPYRLTQVVTFIFTCLVLAGCAKNQLAISESIRQQSEKIAVSATYTAEQAIDTAEQMFLEAKNAELDLYAPLHMKQARESIQQARAYLINSPENFKHAGLMSAIASQHFITAGYENKKLVQGHLAKALAHRDLLISLGTPTLIPEDYQAVIDDLRELTELIESGEATEAIKKQDALWEEMNLLEINTLNILHLASTESFLAKANEINAAKYAEDSYEKAINKLEAARTYIQKNYRDRKGVERYGNEALRAMQHAYYTALDAEKITGMSADEAEQYVLHIASLLDQINQRANDRHFEPQKLNDSYDQLLQSVGDIKNKLANSRQQTNKTSLQLAENETVAETTVDTEPLDLRAANANLPENELPNLKLNELQEDEQGFDSVEIMSSEDQ